MWRALSRAYDAFVEFFSSLALFVMFWVVMYGIFSRYFISRPGFWIEELARYSMFVMTLTGSAIAIAKNIHPALTFVTDGFRGTAKLIVDLWVECLMLLTLLLLGYAGWVMTFESTRIRTVGMRIHYSYIYFFIPFGCFLMLIAVVRRLAALRRDKAGTAEAPGPDGAGEGRP